MILPMPAHTGEAQTSESESKMKAETKQVMDAYHAKHRALYAYTTSGECVGRAGNGWASAFWAGFDGYTHGARVPARNAISRPWYLAGIAARKQEKQSATSASQSRRGEFQQPART